MQEQEKFTRTHKQSMRAKNETQARKNKMTKRKAKLDRWHKHVTLERESQWTVLIEVSIKLGVPCVSPIFTLRIYIFIFIYLIKTQFITTSF